MRTQINLEEIRKNFQIALLEKRYDDAFHIISGLHDAGFPRLALGMTEDLDLAQSLDADEEDEMELEYEQLQTLRQITV